MLRGLLGFGKEDRPQPPKGKIEVICPTCGALQYEPRLVVSTFCKKCGDHLRIEKKRVIGTGFRLDRNPEVITTAPPSKREVKVGKDISAPDAPPPDAPVKEVLVPKSTVPRRNAGSILRSIVKVPADKQEETPPENGTAANPPPDDFEADESGFGAMLQRVAEEIIEKPVEKTVPKRLSHQPPPTAAPPPASASTLQKMKNQGFYRQQYFKEAQCFDCRHSFKVGRSARSANCPQCGAWISMEDVEINMNSTQAIKTRGDVIIRKRGHLSTSSVQCKDFQCQGLLEANVNASGDAVFRTNGKVIGEIRCHRFVIEKGAEVTFVNPIYADQVEIHAKICGTVFSRGSVLITTYGAVDGDVTARSVSIEPGGELNGAMNIIRGEDVLFDPTKKE